jgi:PadR family transcriptional regulator, regulatory protein PadR
LEEQGYLKAEWQQPQTSGRPPRHAYRLTPSGVTLALNNPPQHGVTKLTQQSAKAI